MKIGFHANRIGLSETTLNYARFNEICLGNESFFIAPKNADHHPLSVERYHRLMNVVLYDTHAELVRMAEWLQLDAIYYLQSGEPRPEVIVPGVPSIIHAVFDCRQPWGDRFAVVSRWMTETNSGGRIPFVPYIVTMPRTERSQRELLRIPQTALVFGIMGNSHAFDIDWAVQAIVDVAERHPRIYFILVNSPWIEAQFPNIICLGPIADPLEKSAVINTCDAMVHIRARGETAGVTVGEFSVLNKPVIAWDSPPEKAHLFELGDKAFTYHNYSSLVRLLTNFECDPHANWDGYGPAHAPNVVMQKFNEVFLQNLGIARYDNSADYEIRVANA